MTARPLMAALTLAVGLLAGCGKKADKAPPPPPPEVVVVSPVVQQVTDVEEFTGWTRAVKTVEIRARVTGYLDEVKFRDGDDVKAGAPLFVIDARTYQAEVDKAESTVKQTEATLEKVSNELTRVLRAGGAVSLDERDKLKSTRSEADASVKASRAALETARLNLGFTKVAAPITGRVSRTMVDPGNLVKSDDTMLTTIVALDPIHAYFDIDERTVLKLRKMIREKKIDSARDAKIEVKVGLADEEGFSLTGTIDFVDNQLDAGTGTLRVRAEVPNPPVGRAYMLSPGMFVRIQLPVGKPQASILVPETALGSDQGSKIVLVVVQVTDKEGKAGWRVESRKVTVGQQEGALRVIRSGVEKGDRVIVTGQQRVRPGGPASPITPEEVQRREKELEAKAREKQETAH